MSLSRVAFVVELALLALPVTLLFVVLAFFYLVFGSAEVMGRQATAGFGVVLFVGGCALVAFWRIAVSFVRAGQVGLRQVSITWFALAAIGAAWAIAAFTAAVVTYYASSD